MIELKNISKSYPLSHRSVPVLKSLSLSVAEGDSLAVLGASGCGKSTLLNILGLLDSPDSGHYFFKHQNTADMNADERAGVRNHDIGFVFQQFHLLPRLTVRQNVALPLAYRSVSPDAMEYRINHALQKVGMDAYRQHRPSQLSGGQQQRVAIARALAGNPRLILADEPTGALDSKTGAEILNLFLKLQEEGCTLIMVTHDEMIARRCHRQIIMRDGQVVNEEIHAMA